MQRIALIYIIKLEYFLNLNLLKLIKIDSTYSEWKLTRFSQQK